MRIPSIGNATAALSAALLIGPFVLGISMAAAQPLGPAVNTTCSYDQIVAALQVEAPALAGALDANPEAQAKLRAFLALPADERRQRIDQRLDANPQWRTTLDQKLATPEGQEKKQMLLRVADICHTF